MTQQTQNPQAATTLPVHIVEFDATGTEVLVSNEKVSEKVLALLKAEPITDVFLISHGWLADYAGAVSQYTSWEKAMAQSTNDIAAYKAKRPGFSPLIVGIHWPSLPAGFDKDTGGQMLLAESKVDDYAQRIKNTPEVKLALSKLLKAADLNRQIITNDSTERTLVAGFSDQPSDQDLETSALTIENALALPQVNGFDMLKRFSSLITSMAQNFGNDFVDLVKNIPDLFIKVSSFWAKRDLGEKIGRTAVHNLLNNLMQAKPDADFHLAGHSFGCLVQSGALAGSVGGTPLVRPVSSLSLLQGAAPIWSYCLDMPCLPGTPGDFSLIIKNNLVSGIMLSTVSDNDTAVGFFYPLAQMVYGPHYVPTTNPYNVHSGLGQFGARGYGISVKDILMLPVGSNYVFDTKVITNINGTRYISHKDNIFSGAHCDIAEPEVAHAVWSAASASI